MSEINPVQREDRNRVHLSLRVSAQTHDYMKELGELYNCNKARLIDAIFETYAPALIRDVKRSKK
jgi:hypothetical protein